jgi:ABC-type multidrug transport system fused ATPase/permease subunit
MSKKENKPESERKGSFKRARKILSYTKPYRFSLVLSFVFLLLGSATVMTFPLLMGSLFTATTAESPDVKAIDLNNANTVAFLLLIVFVAQSVFSFLRIVIGSRVTEKVLADIRQDAYKVMITLPVSFFHRNKVGELTSRLSSDISMLQETLNTTAAEFFRQLIVIVVGLAFLSLISWKLMLIMLASVPVMAIIAVVFGRYIKRLSKDAQDKVAESNAIVEETLTAIASVKAYANEFLEILRYKKATNQVRDISIRVALKRGAFVSFIIFAMFGSIVFVLWQGVLLTQKGEISSEELFQFVLLSVFLGASFGSLPDLYAKLQRSFGATERLLEMLQEPTEKIKTDKKYQPLERLKGEVEFMDLHFAYESRKDIPVLQGVSLKVKAGQQVALVGSSGAGKSTIASMLLRFFEPTSGKITFDGKDSTAFDLTDLRSQMALVPQEVILFGGTIRENIAYGKPDATDDEIREAALKANALEFIDKFPEKLNTIVGDRGVQLSGGQRQRIAIARAVLKNPSILILDEATSSLDSESERLVQDALNKLMEGRTSFVIAHRLSTIRNADQIFVIDNGRVHETGTHDELMQVEEGIYGKLIKMQYL